MSNSGPLVGGSAFFSETTLREHIWNACAPAHLSTSQIVFGGTTNVTVHMTLTNEQLQRLMAVLQAGILAVLPPWENEQG